MIVPMKKVHIVVQKKDVVSALESLRDLGVVHVEHQDELTGQQLARRREAVKMIQEVLDILKTVKHTCEQEDLYDWTDLGTGILKNQADIEHIKEEMVKRQALMVQWEPWGDFNPADFIALEKSGVYVRLCEIFKSDLNKVPSGVIIQEISSSKGLVRCVAISREPVRLPFESVTLPAMGLREMRSRQEADKIKIEQFQKEIFDSAKYIRSLEDMLVRERNVLQFEEVEKGMREEESLEILKGYVPIDKENDVRRMAKEEQWGLLVEKPSTADVVPTVIRNPKWVDIIKPLFAFINVLPGYRELDVSLVFLIFFSIFFGILIGDAGYGLIFFLLTLFAQKKLKNKVENQAPFILMYVLSACAIIWGILTGAVFGTLLLGKIVKPIIFWLTENKNVQLVCFLLGAIHLTIAHLWRLLMRIPAVFSALAELGWIIVIWGAFFLANVMVIDRMLLGLDIERAFMIVGVGAVLIIADIISRPKDGIAVGLVLSFFSFISAFTDVVSYIRLFAVGLAGVAVANSFSEIALGLGFNSFLNGLLTSLILVVGHLFNVVLCCFGILVHGLRLNVLEFSGHLGLEWAGVKYEPFKKVNK